MSRIITVLFVIMGGIGGIYAGLYVLQNIQTPVVVETQLVESVKKPEPQRLIRATPTPTPTPTPTTLARYTSNYRSNIQPEPVTSVIPEQKVVVTMASAMPEATPMPTRNALWTQPQPQFQATPVQIAQVPSNATPISQNIELLKQFDTNGDGVIDANEKTAAFDEAVKEKTETQPANNIPVGVPKDAYKYKGHAYKIFYQKLNWQEAKQRCEAMGGHLVTIGNPEEENVVAQLVIKSGRALTPRASIWLGATDENDEGNWQWVDGTPWKFSLWRKAQQTILVEEKIIYCYGFLVGVGPTLLM